MDLVTLIYSNHCMDQIKEIHKRFVRVFALEAGKCVNRARTRVVGHGEQQVASIFGESIPHILRQPGFDENCGGATVLFLLSSL